MNIEIKPTRKIKTMNNSKTMMRKLAIFGTVTALGLTVSVQANVEHRRQWKPTYTTEVMKAPAPPDAEQRAREFAERNSSEHIEALAREFFELVDLRQVRDVQRLYVGGEFQAALDAYRDFFIERLRMKEFPMGVGSIVPRHPDERIFVEFLHEPDELLNNVLTLAMVEGEGKIWPLAGDLKRVTVKWRLGDSGRINWLAVPEGFSNAGRHINFGDQFIAHLLSQPHVFNVLLSAYLKTQDARYLHKWCELNDERYMRLRGDAWTAGVQSHRSANEIEYYTRGTLSHLAWLARHAPAGFEQELSSATLVRELLRMTKEYLPDAMQGMWTTTPNRQIHMYSSHPFNLGIAFPEIKPFAYSLREALRLSESYATVSLLPDGSDVEDSRNYNYAYLAMAHRRQVLSDLAPNQRPAWVNPLWHRELTDHLHKSVRFLLHDLWPSGGHPNWSPLRSQANKFTGDSMMLPDALTDPQNARIISAVFNQGNGAHGVTGVPHFTSDAHPYAGYYYIRSGWGENDQYLYLQSTRPMMSATWQNNNNILLRAFGRDIFIFGRNTPVVVDNLPQIGNGDYPRYPPEYKAKRFEPLFGKWNSGSHYETPRKHRWHNSDLFDLAEGVYNGPFARTDSGYDRFVDDVEHRRQVLFVRHLGVWVLLDRLHSPQERTYRFGFPFHGFDRKHIVANPDAFSIRTEDPDGVNLTIRQFSATPGRKLNELVGAGAQQMISVLYPRQKIEHDLKSIEALPGDGSTAGFIAGTPDGGKIWFQSAPESGELSAGPVTVTGESLLLVTLPDGSQHGIALGCTALAIDDKPQDIPQADFDFSLGKARDNEQMTSPATRYSLLATPIFVPMDMPAILPQPDRFSEPIEITMSHNEPDTVIRYALDGTDPDGDSPVYEKPIPITNTTVVKARAFRRGVSKIPESSDSTRVSEVMRAVYTRAEPRKAALPLERAQVQGLDAAYYEEGYWPISALILDTLKPVKTGGAHELFDLRAKNTDGGYAFVYTGFLKIDQPGIYSFHSPRELIYPPVNAGYQLRLFLGNEEWYPTTRRHNYGVWSVPLDAGLHALRVVFVDQRNARMSIYRGRPKDGKPNDWMWMGDKPELKISGPGIEPQPIPAAMLYGGNSESAL